MRLILIDALPAEPWKNKGGVTRQLASCIDEPGIVWRLSVANVDQAGAFSIYPGAGRILTVIDGAGLRMRHAAGVIDARPGVPVAFSGDTPIYCDLVDGPVRDFNLIYDPARTQASVERLQSGERPTQAAGRPFGLLPLFDACSVKGFGAVSPGAFLEFGEDALPEIELSTGAAALLVRIG